MTLHTLVTSSEELVKHTMLCLTVCVACSYCAQVMGQALVVYEAALGADHLYTARCHATLGLLHDALPHIQSPWQPCPYTLTNIVSLSFAASMYGVVLFLCNRFERGTVTTYSPIHT